MDPDAGSIVLNGVTILAAFGAGIGAVFGAGFAEPRPPGATPHFAKRAPSVVMALSTGLNCGLGGLAFFSLREYFISPILVKNLNSDQYIRRREAILLRSTDAPLPSALTSNTNIHDIRTRKLLDSGLSGAIAGAILYPIKRGRAGILPGAVTSALLCTIIQYAANEMSIARIRFVASLTNTHPPIPASSSPTSQTPPTTPPYPHNAPEQRQSSPQREEPAHEPQKAVSLSERIMNGMTWVAPVKKLSDEEYMALMERQRAALDKQLNGLKSELDKQETDEKGKSPS